MRENQLPVHYTSAEETGQVRPAVGSGDGVLHISRDLVTHVEAKPAKNYLADDLSNSVQITLTKRVIEPGSDEVMCLSAQTSIPISDDEISSVSNLVLQLADGTKVALSVSFFNDEAAQNVTPMPGAEPPMHFSAAGSASAAPAVALAPRALPAPGKQYVAYDPERIKLEEARDSKIDRWVLTAAVIFVTALYTICNPKWVTRFVAQTGNVSKQLSADIKSKTSAPLGGTAVTDNVKVGAGAVAPASLRDVDPSADLHYGSSNDSGSGGEILPALSPQSTPIANNPMDFMNQGVNQGFTIPATAMPKAAEAKTSISKRGFMVPPPPATPCVLLPGFSFFTAQPGQQHPALQQQIQQAQAQASTETFNQDAARENTPQQSTAASSKTEATQSAALVAADQELQAALSTSLLNVGEWKR